MASSTKITFDIPAAMLKVRGNVVRAMGAATLQSQSELVVKLSQPGSGRIYGKHQASAPGEPPAPDTGDLRRSVVTEVALRDGDVVGKVIENKEYALALELGTDKIAPRPHLRQSVVEGWPRIMAAFKANF